MANNNNKKNTNDLLFKLTPALERREDGGVTEKIPTGRFKYFMAVSKERSSSLLTGNLFFLIFTLPLLAIYVLITAFGGVETIAYKLQNIDAPYLLTAIGFGVSNSTSTILDVQNYMYNIYYLIMLAAGVGAFIMSFGLSGMMYLSMKYILKDSFISKKDKYGNDEPVTTKEYWKGFRLYAPQFALVGLFLFILVAGFGNVFVYFAQVITNGSANVGHWFMVIIAGIISLLYLMFLLHLMPQIVLYDIPFKDKMKNALILTFRFILQNILAVAAFSVLFILMFTIKNFIGIIFIAIMIVFGSKYYCLTMCNYEQYIAENIITPLYYTINRQNRPKKKKK